MRTAIVLGLLLASGCGFPPAGATAGPPEPGPMPHLVDLYGDPLPTGAIARFGSVRLRHANLSDFTLLPDKRTAVTVGGDGMVRWWDWKTGRQTRAVPFQGKDFWNLTISRDGSQIAFYEPDGEARIVVCDTLTGRIIQTLTSHGSAEDLSFSPDGSTLAFGAKASRLTRVTIRTGKSAETQFGTPHDQHFGPFLPPLSISFSQDGKRIVAGGIHGDDHTAEVIDAVDLQRVFAVPGKLQAQALSPDGTRLIVYPAWQEGSKSAPLLREYDLKTGKPIDRFSIEIEDECTSIAYSLDGKFLVCTDWGSAQVLDAVTGKVRIRVPQFGQAKISADGGLLAVADGPRLRLWDVANGRELHNRPGAIH